MLISRATVMIIMICCLEPNSIVKKSVNIIRQVLKAGLMMRSCKIDKDTILISHPRMLDHLLKGYNSRNSPLQSHKWHSHSKQIMILGIIILIRGLKH